MNREQVLEQTIRDILDSLESWDTSFAAQQQKRELLESARYLVEAHDATHRDV